MPKVWLWTIGTWAARHSAFDAPGHCRGGLLSLGDPRAAIARNPIPTRKVFLAPAAPAFHAIQKSRSLSASPLAQGPAMVMPTAPVRPAFVRKLGLSPVTPSSGKDILRYAVLPSWHIHHIYDQECRGLTCLACPPS